MRMLQRQRQVRYAGALLSILLIYGYRVGANAHASISRQHDTCLNGMVSYQAGINGKIHVCGAITQADPKLAEQMDQVEQLLSSQQEQLKRLTRSLNAVGSNLDLGKQVQMLQTLVSKLGSTPETATVQAGHVTTALETVEEQIRTVGDDPATSAAVRSKMHGSLGDAIAELDTSEAVAELNDVRAEVHKIDETTTRTDQTTTQMENEVRQLKKSMDAQFHPEGALPPDEAKLFVQATPLVTEFTQFTLRWMNADLNALRSRSNSPGAVSSFRDKVRQASSPASAEYQQILPQLNEWRNELAKRVPAISDELPFGPAADEGEVRKAQDRVGHLLHQYVTGDPNPSNALARQGHDLQAQLINIASDMHEAYATASASEMQQRRTYVPRPQSTSDEGTDGPMAAQFHGDLESKLQAWQAGVKRFVPDYSVVDFSSVKTGRDLQQLQAIFVTGATRAYQAMARQAHDSPDAKP